MFTDPVTEELQARGTKRPAQKPALFGVCVCGGSPASRECVIRAEAARRGAVRRKQPRLERRGRRGKEGYERAQDHRKIK